jgi:Mg-chelatase subunit ChlD
VSDELHDDDRNDDQQPALVGADRVTETERKRRWRLVLGGEGKGSGGEGSGEFSLDQLADLSKEDRGRDGALEALYSDSERRGGLGASSPKVSRWLGDVRTYFPASVVKVMQKDAMDRLGLRQLLMEKEMLENVEPDINLVSTIVGLNHMIPEESKDTARQVVRALVKQLEERPAAPMREAVSGALNRATRTNRPKRPSEVDWNRTIRVNLKNYIPDSKIIIPERLVGYGRRSTEVQRDIILCIDQSGSMAASVVYSSVFGAVLASLRSVRTRLVVFDTAIVDLTDQLEDPVDVLFAVQLGGGTDIAGALGYCESVVTTPHDTIMILISDLYEGGVTKNLYRRAASLVAAGVTVIALLALSDEGRPAYDAHNASVLASLGVPAFACTPDLFPAMMAAAIQRQDISVWASADNIVTAAPVKHVT